MVLKEGGKKKISVAFFFFFLRAFFKSWALVSNVRYIRIKVLRKEATLHKNHKCILSLRMPQVYILTFLLSWFSKQPLL